jgi:uncharacterized LabA/DUF88 family protein
MKLDLVFISFTKLPHFQVYRHLKSGRDHILIQKPPTTPYNIFPPVAAVLFDGSYWNFVRRIFGSLDVDLTALSDAICQPAYRLRTYYFDGKDTHRQSFHDGIRILPRFEVILGDVVERETECPHCKKPINVKEQKRVDVQLAVQMVHLATTRQVSLIVLVAGDRDFIPSIEMAKHSGVIVRLVHGPPKTTSTDLRQFADETMELTEEFLQKFLREPKEKFGKKTSRAKTKTIKKPTTKAINNLNVEMDVLLKNAIQKTPISPNGVILASQLGITLSEIEPQWKSKYGYSSLANLLERNTSPLFTPKRKGKILSIVPDPKLVAKSSSKTVESKDDMAVTFLLDTLKKLQKSKKFKPVRLAALGIILTKSNPNWKKTYSIKKLDALIQLAGDKIITEGDGVDKHIRLNK